MDAHRGDDEELAALRRRLYAPDASDEDRAAFQAAEAARSEAAAVAAEAPVAPVVVEELPPAAPEPRTLPRRFRIAAIGAATVLVVAGVVGVAVGHPFRPAPVTASPTPAVSVIGSIAVPASVQAGFVRDLRAGRDPQLLRYLDVHPETLLAPMRATGQTDTTGFTGVGPTTLNLAPMPARTAGHITLVLVTDRGVHFQWTPTTVAESNDRSGPERPVADLGGAAEAGQPVSGTVAFSGGVPSRLTLLVPAVTRWSLVVVFTG